MVNSLVLCFSFKISILATAHKCPFSPTHDGARHKGPVIRQQQHNCKGTHNPMEEGKSFKAMSKLQKSLDMGVKYE